MAKPKRKTNRHLLDEYQYILTSFPVHVATGFNKLLGATNKKEKVLSSISTTERILEHLFSFMLGSYIDTRQKEPECDKCSDLEERLWSAFGTFSFGSMLDIVRLMNSYTKKNNLSFFPEKMNFRGLDKTISKMVTFRNKQSHGILTEKEYNDVLDTFYEVLDGCDFFKTLRIFVPITYNSLENEYSGFMYCGCGSHPVYTADIQVLGKMQLQNVYCVDTQFKNIFSLDPFWKSSFTKNGKSANYHLYFVSIRNGKGILNDHSTGDRIESKAVFEEYQKMINSLAPDYKYQKQVYLRGHSLLIKTHRIDIIQTSYDGDTKTFMEKDAMKITYPSNINSESSSLKLKSEDETCIFDYHDAPIFPIDDSTFNLQLSEASGKEVRLEYQIHNDSFRKFHVFLPGMKFEEMREIRLNCFEPMLFDGIIKGDEEYYEIEVDHPTEELQFSVKLLPGIEISSATLQYMDGSGISTSETTGQNGIKIKQLPTGENTASFRVLRPVVGRQLLFKFKTIINQNRIKKSSSSDSMDHFRAGYKVYESMKNNRDKNWTVAANNDSIIIKPVEKNE